jgi:hypothetical protein
VKTVILPEGYEHRTIPQSPTPSPGAAAPTNAQSPASKQSVGRTQLPAIRPTNQIWALAGATIAVVVLSLGAILSLRWARHGVNDVAPPASSDASDQQDDSGRSKVSPPSGHSSKPAERRLAKTPTEGGSDDNAPLGRQTDVAGQLRTAKGSAFRRLRLIVPTYIYPTGDGRKEWQRLLDAASKVEIIAIANPDSGPGPERNPDYASIFTEARNQGITVVGYVTTNYGKRPQPDIKNDIDGWVRLYPQIRGFFFDQQPPERQQVGKFAELRDYAKEKLPDALVITNPGVPCDEAYLSQAVSNVTCIFGNFEGFDRFEVPATLKAYEPIRFAAMPYNIAGVDAMKTALRDAIIKQIGYIYISDGKPPTQWSKLPGYWEAEVEAVSRLR